MTQPPTLRGRRFQSAAEVLAVLASGFGASAACERAPERDRPAVEAHEVRAFASSAPRAVDAPASASSSDDSAPAPPLAAMDMDASAPTAPSGSAAASAAPPMVAPPAAPSLRKLADLRTISVPKPRAPRAVEPFQCCGGRPSCGARDCSKDEERWRADHLGDSTVTVGLIPGAALDPPTAEGARRAIQRVRSYLTRCHVAVLATDPDAFGRAGVTVHKDSSGQATVALELPNALRPLRRCLTQVLDWMFRDLAPGAAEKLTFAIAFEVKR